MKKTLAVLLLAVMIAASMTACGKKEALSVADFTAKAAEAGLTVEDASDTYNDSIFTDALLAKKGSDFSIVYLAIDTEEHAKTYWATCKTYMEGQKTGAGSSQTTDNNNYKMYMQSNGGRFMYACQIGATLVYVDEDDAQKDAIKEVLKKLGY